MSYIPASCPVDCKNTGCHCESCGETGIILDSQSYCGDCNLLEWVASTGMYNYGHLGQLVPSNYNDLRKMVACLIAIQNWEDEEDDHSKLPSLRIIRDWEYKRR